MSGAWTPFDDAPLTNLEHDALGRLPVVNQLVSAVDHIAVREESSVIAVVGRWGSGKTTVVNAALRMISEDVLVTHFNPWSYATPEAATAGFTRGIQRHFGAKSKTRETLGRFLIQHSAFGGLGSLIGADLEGPLGELGKLITGDSSLYDERSKVEDALRQFGRGILIVVDDVDRLEPSELMTTFRLVRQLGRLPFLHYILCFDESTLLDVLRKTGLAGDNPARAREYLEKIVQARIDVSAPNGRRLVRSFAQALEEFAVERAIPFGTNERERLFRAWGGGLEFYLDRPRNLKRLLGQLVLVWPALGSGVEFVDLVLAQVLHMFEPDLMSNLRRKSPRDLAQTWAGLLHEQELARTKGEERALVEASFNILKAASEPEAAVSLLRVLLEAKSDSGSKVFSDPRHVEKYLTLADSGISGINPRLLRAIDSLVGGDPAVLEALLPNVAKDPLGWVEDIRGFNASEPLSVKVLVQLVSLVADRLASQISNTLVTEYQLAIGELRTLFCEGLNVEPADAAVLALDELASTKGGLLVVAPLVAFEQPYLACRPNWWESGASISALFKNPEFAEYGMAHSSVIEALFLELSRRAGDDGYQSRVLSLIDRVADAHGSGHAILVGTWARKASSAWNWEEAFNSSERLRQAVPLIASAADGRELLGALWATPDGRRAVVSELSSGVVPVASVLALLDDPSDDLGIAVVTEALAVVRNSLTQTGDDRWISVVSMLANSASVVSVSESMWALLEEHEFLDAYELANTIFDKGAGMTEVELAFGLDRVAQWLAKRPSLLLRARGRGQTERGETDLIHLLDETYGLASVKSDNQPSVAVTGVPLPPGS